MRSGDNAKRLLEAIEAMRPQLAADTRFHLRHETYNLEGEARIIKWLSEGRIDLFAFNDHMDSTVGDLAKPHKRIRMVERTGLTSEAFDKLVARVVSRAHDVPASIVRLAQAARDADVLLTDARLPQARHVAVVGERRLAGTLPPLPAQPLYVDPPEARRPAGGLRPPPAA